MAPPMSGWTRPSRSMVAMVLHELATNAVKYGALSNGGGRVSVAWEQRFQPNLVKLVWQESGGPEVSPPTAKRLRIAPDRACIRGSARHSATRVQSSKAFLAHSKSALITPEATAPITSARRYAGAAEEPHPRHTQSRGLIAMFTQDFRIGVGSTNTLPGPTGQALPSSR